MNPLLCKLFEHCALAQRSEASERCSGSQSGSEIRFFIIFMILIILGSLMAELRPSIFHIHNASIELRLCMQAAFPYAETRLSVWREINDRILRYFEIRCQFFF